MTSTLFPVGSFYPAQTGGPDNTVYWITKALKKEKDNPIIIATERGLQPEVKRNHWLDTEYGKVIYTKNRIHYFPLRLIFTAVNQIKSADVIHLAMIFYPASFLIAFINQLFYKKPVIWSVHGDLDLYMLKRSAWKKRPVLFLLQRFLKSNVVFHVTCDAEASYVKANFGQDAKMAMLPNYMEFPPRMELPKKNQLLYIGRIDKKKAIENLIEALKNSEVFLQSDYTLKIAGNNENSYGKMLKELVDKYDLKDRVEFLGHIEGEEKQRYLSESKFVVMPSHTENFGIVIMEGLIQGTPGIASTGTPWGVLESYKAGLWTDNDVPSLISNIDKAISMSPKSYDQMSKQALVLVQNEFNIYEKIKDWQSTYEAVKEGQMFS